MIDDEEIKLEAMRCGFQIPSEQFVAACLPKEQINDFARAIYQLGRQHQRESDANELMSMSHDCTRYEYIEAIIANTEGHCA